MAAYCFSFSKALMLDFSLLISVWKHLLVITVFFSLLLNSIHHFKTNFKLQILDLDPRFLYILFHLMNHLDSSFKVYLEHLVLSWKEFFLLFSFVQWNIIGIVKWCMKTVNTSFFNAVFYVCFLTVLMNCLWKV